VRTSIGPVLREKKVVGVANAMQETSTSAPEKLGEKKPILLLWKNHQRKKTRV